MASTARIGRRLALALALCAALGCDKMYEARLTAMTSGQDAASLASGLVAELRGKLGVTCDGPTASVDPPASLDHPEYSYECEPRDDNTRIGIVAGGGQVVVHLSEIGGYSEPERFRSTRLGAAAYLSRVLPPDQVFIEYPYRQ